MACIYQEHRAPPRSFHIQTFHPEGSIRTSHDYSNLEYWGSIGAHECHGGARGDSFNGGKSIKKIVVKYLACQIYARNYTINLLTYTYVKNAVFSNRISFVFQSLKLQTKSNDDLMCSSKWRRLSTICQVLRVPCQVSWEVIDSDQETEALMVIQIPYWWTFWTDDVIILSFYYCKHIATGLFVKYGYSII